MIGPNYHAAVSKLWVMHMRGLHNDNLETVDAPCVDELREVTTTRQVVDQMVNSSVSSLHRIEQVDLDKRCRDLIDEMIDLPQVKFIEGQEKMILTKQAATALSDTGANINMCGDMSVLTQVVPITPFPVGVAVDGQGPSVCTHKGVYPIQDARSGNTHDVTMFFNPDATGIIISPSATLRESDIFDTCSQTIHKDDRPGTLKFASYTGFYSLQIDLIKRDGLYYIPTARYKMVHSILGQWQSGDDDDFDYLWSDDPYDAPRPAAAVQAVSGGRPRFDQVQPHKQIESELWALRMGSCSETQLRQLSDAADGIPKNFEFHPFRQIDFKTQARIRKKMSGKSAAAVHQRGKKFYMDYGFMRASTSDFTRRQKGVDRVVTSFDGYNSYLLIVDEYSRHVWVLLTKSKEPPIKWVNLFLAINGCDDGGVVRCDQGGELASSHEFITSVLEENKYTVEPTGADSPNQNGGVEKYNDTLAVMVRTLLYGANLNATYWSAALLHAVYLVNRRVHAKTKATPYERWFGHRPNLQQLKTFGSRVCVKRTGHRQAKLDKHHFDGLFIGYSCSDENIRYIDLSSGRVKLCHHAYFDECWYLQDSRPPAAQLLYDLGVAFDQPEPPPPAQPPPPPIAAQPPLAAPSKRFSKVGDAMNSPLPLRWEATPNLVGAKAASTDGACYKDTVLDPAKSSKLFDDYNIARRDLLQVYMSSDPYRDEFTRQLDLRGLNVCQHKAAGLSLVQRDGRLVLQHMVMSTPAAKMHNWRSTMKGAWLRRVNGQAVTTLEDVHRIFDELSLTDQKECELVLSHPEISHGLTETGIPQCNIDQMNPRPQLLGGPLLPNMSVAKQAPPPNIVDSFGGVLIDGLPTANKLTRGKLLKQDDWTLWEQSEFEQLNQYKAQGMFGKIVKLHEIEAEMRQRKPLGTDEQRKPLGLAELGVFRLVWTYAEKRAGDVKIRRKSRAAVDGSPKAAAANVIGQTYANCVDQTAARLFYAITAAENLLIYGADVKNAFAEAPPPDQNFYIKPDRAFNNWWENCLGNPPLAPDEVITGQRAFQGHPEAPRLWEKYSDKILRQIGFKPTTHEPCLYSGIIDNERVLLMKQVDDFALSAPSERIANLVYDAIDEHITFPIKRLGLATLFNGLDVDQTAEYIKISAESFLDKIMENHLAKWIPHAHELKNMPTPLPTVPAFLKGFLSSEGDRLENGQPDPVYQREAERESQLPSSYRSALGECTYAMATCRPDIAHAVVKLSQFSVCPHKLHYSGLKHLLKYLYHTKSDGLYFWRETANPILTKKDRPRINSNRNDLLWEHRREFGPSELNGSADSDWGTCPKTRRSFSGMIIRMAGGTVAYKTRLQSVIAQSSTEAELMAANDAGKMILYIRSILWDLGIPQLAATVIGEDNDACTAIGNAQKPTPRTKHVDIKQRAIADWIERDLLKLERVDTSVNLSDQMTKLLSRILFHRHNDYILGHVPPGYTRAYKEYFGTGLKVDLNTGDKNPTTSADKRLANSLAARWDHICLYS